MVSEYPIKPAKGMILAIILASAVLAGCATNRTTSSLPSSLVADVGNAPKLTDTAGDPLPVMTLSTVLAYTVDHNPDVGIARAQASDADAGVRVAVAPMLPSVGYSIASGHEQTYATDTDILTNANRQEASITASQLIWDFGKSEADITRAEALSQSASLRASAKINEIALSTIEAYLGLLELDMQLDIAEKNVAAHEEMHRIVALNEKNGNGTMADVQKALTRLEAARNRVIDLRAERRSAASGFLRVTGLAPSKLQLPRPPTPPSRPSSQQVRAFIASDPTLLSLEKDRQALMAQKQALLLDHLPRITLDGQAKYQQNVAGVNPANTSGRLMLTISGSLFDGGDRMSKIAQVNARIDEVEYRQRRAIDNLEFDIDDATRVLETARSRTRSIADQIASARKVVSLYTQQFQSGERSIFELLDAQQELSTAQSAQVTARFNVLRAQYHMLAYTGALTLKSTA